MEDLIIKIAKSEDEKEECFRIRHKIYSAEGYIKKEDFPDGLEKDKYDSFSTNFYAYNTQKKEVVGAIRIIHDSGIGLELEQIFDISAFKMEGSKIAEVSRRVTLPNNVKANLGLMKIVCQYGRLKGITDFLCTIDITHTKFYERLGFEKISETKYYPDVDRYTFPVHIKLSNFKKPYNKMLFEPCNNVILE